MRIDRFVQLNTHHPRLIAAAGINVASRHDTGLHNSLVMIDIMQKGIECGNTLLTTSLYLLPFTGSNDARDNIKRYHTLNIFSIAIDRKGDTFAVKDIFGLLI